jgi:hypothetical protein
VVLGVVDGSSSTEDGEEEDQVLAALDAFKNDLPPTREIAKEFAELDDLLEYK